VLSISGARVVGGGPGAGVVSLDADAGISMFKADDAFTGPVTLEYAISDQIDQLATAEVRLMVADQPMLLADAMAKTVAVGKTVTFAAAFTVDAENGASPIGCLINPPVAGVSAVKDALVTFDATTTSVSQINVLCMGGVAQATNTMALQVTVRMRVVGR